MTPLLRFDNFLEELIELRKTIYLLDYQIIIKDTGQGHPDGRGVEGRVCGRGTQLPRPLWAHTSAGSPAQFSKPFGWVFMEASLRGCD